MKAPVSLVRGDGHLGAPGRTADGAPPRPLREALRELGYVESKNIVYEARFAEGMFERLPELVGRSRKPRAPSRSRCRPSPCAVPRTLRLRLQR